MIPIIYTESAINNMETTVLYIAGIVTAVANAFTNELASIAVTSAHIIAFSGFTELSKRHVFYFSYLTNKKNLL